MKIMKIQLKIKITNFNKYKIKINMSKQISL